MSSLRRGNPKGSAGNTKPNSGSPKGSAGNTRLSSDNPAGSAGNTKARSSNPKGSAGNTKLSSGNTKARLKSPKPPAKSLFRIPRTALTVSGGAHSKQGPTLRSDDGGLKFRLSLRLADRFKVGFNRCLQTKTHLNMGRHRRSSLAQMQVRRHCSACRTPKRG